MAFDFKKEYKEFYLPKTKPEIVTVPPMDAFVQASGCANDLTDARRHHEIYLSDVRKTAPEKLKTVIRHPIKKL